MGHKVHPIGFRLGVIEGWQSRWYAQRNYKELLAEDRTLREAVRKRLANASVSKVEIERVAGTNIGVTIHTAKPGIVIGKNGESVERLRQDLERVTKKKVRLNILEIRNPDVDATLVARSIAEQLERRVAFRRAMKQAVQKAMRANAKGIKVIAGGRLGGAEIARVEKEVEGSVPLQTLRANIDYGFAEAHTTYGTIGVKVWIYHGDILPERQRGEAAIQSAQAQPGERGDRGPRGDRGDRGDRGERRGGPGGERGDRGERRGGPGGDRGPRGDRPAGDRGPRGDRPAGDRGPRSDRGPRPTGDRGPRPDRPQGGAGLSNAAPRPAGDRGPRAPRPEGAAGPRPDRGPRAERPAQPEGGVTPQANAEATPTTPTAQAEPVEQTPPPTMQTEQAPQAQPTQAMEPEPTHPPTTDEAGS